MKLDRIVVGIDFSWPSITTMQWVSRAFAPEAEIVLVHALQVPDAPNMLQEPGTTETLVEIATEGARRRLRATLNTLVQPNTSAIVRRGAPDVVLAAVAEEVGADLIAVGPHRRRHGLWERLDTTVEHLVTRASVPVLLLPAAPSQPIAHVLVPTEDATPCAATHCAEALATKLGVELTRLTVVTASVPSHLLATAPGATAAEAEPDPAAAGRDGWIGALLGTGEGHGAGRHETAFGEPGQEILAMAERRGSLVVMGRQRAGNLRRAFLGSVTREVLRGATTPVIVVREQA